MILGIDTASTELSVGIVHDGKPLVSFSRLIGNSHAEHISQAITFLLGQGRITPDLITHAAVAVGPGSFTGLRIGISFIKGMFFSRPVKVHPVSSLESIAQAFPQLSGIITVVIDARQGNAFVGRFNKKDGCIERLSADEFKPIVQIPDRCAADETVVVDTMGFRKSVIKDHFKKETRLYTTDELALQRGLACAMHGYFAGDDAGAWRDTVDIVPNYLQPPYADKKVV